MVKPLSSSPSPYHIQLLAILATTAMASSDQHYSHHKRQAAGNGAGAGNSANNTSSAANTSSSSSSTPSPTPVATTTTTLVERSPDTPSGGGSSTTPPETTSSSDPPPVTTTNPPVTTTNPPVTTTTTTVPTTSATTDPPSSSTTTTTSSLSDIPPTTSSSSSSASETTSQATTTSRQTTGTHPSGNGNVSSGTGSATTSTSVGPTISNSSTSNNANSVVLPAVLGSVLGLIFLITVATFFYCRFRKGRRFDSKRPLSFLSLSAEATSDFEEKRGSGGLSGVGGGGMERGITAQPSLRYTPPAVNSSPFATLARSMSPMMVDSRGSYQSSTGSSGPAGGGWNTDDEHSRLVSSLRGGLSSRENDPNAGQERGLLSDDGFAYGYGRHEDLTEQQAAAFVATSMIPLAHGDPRRARNSGTSPVGSRYSVTRPDSMVLDILDGQHDHDDGGLGRYRDEPEHDRQEDHSQDLTPEQWQSLQQRRQLEAQDGFDLSAPAPALPPGAPQQSPALNSLVASREHELISGGVGVGSSGSRSQQQKPLTRSRPVSTRSIHSLRSKASNSRLSMKEMDMDLLEFP